MRREPPPDLSAPEDGLLTRPAGPWTRVKLEIIARYLQRFARACQSARQWFYIDGFAGPGINRIEGTGELVYGSPLLALRTEPAFERCLMLDHGEKNISALKARSASFGERAVVRRGDCNVDLVPLLGKHVPDWAPSLCVLDPEGPNLAWETVAGVAAHRVGRTKIEQLILVPSYMGFLRLLPTAGEPTGETMEALYRFFGNMDWATIFASKQAGELSAGQAHDAYIKMYASQLRDQLHYGKVLDRCIRTDGSEGRPLYYLLFATDHDAGANIMDHVFNVAARPYQQTLFTTERDRLLD